MGRRGPAKEPDAVKQRKGVTAPSRLNGLEPLPRRKAPAMPRDMSPKAKTVWRRVIREMESAEVITGADTDILRAYCETVVRYLEAHELYAASSPLITRPGGILVKNPLHQVVRDDADQVRLLARELGLSPSARANLQITPRPDGAGMDDVLGPPGRHLRVVADEG